MKLPPPEPSLVGTASAYYHATRLWLHARDLALRADTVDDGGLTALTSVLFAAISVEAFLNELLGLAEFFPADPAARSLASIVDAVEESRAPTRLKLFVASLALGTRIDGEPHISLALLFRVRDALVHLKQHRITYTESERKVAPKGLLDALRGVGLLEEPDVPVEQSFLVMIGTPSVCRWAVDTAASVFRHVVPAIPSGPFAVHASQISRAVVEAEPITVARRTKGPVRGQSRPDGGEGPS